MDVKILTDADIDYEQGVRRFVGNKELFEKMLRCFLAENDFQEAKDALEKKEFDAMYRHIHTMKGVCGNLSINGLYRACTNLSELLRNKEYDKAAGEFGQIFDMYNSVCSAIKRADGDFA